MLAGFPDGAFHPDVTLTREQGAKIVTYIIPDIPTAPTTPDIPTTPTVPVVPLELDTPQPGGDVKTPEIDIEPTSITPDPPVEEQPGNNDDNGNILLLEVP